MVYWHIPFTSLHWSGGRGGGTVMGRVGQSGFGPKLKRPYVSSEVQRHSPPSQGHNHSLEYSKVRWGNFRSAEIHSSKQLSLSVS